MSTPNEKKAFEGQETKTKLKVTVTKDELTMHRYNRLYTGCVECLLLRRTKPSLDRSDPVFCSIAIKPLALEPGGPHPKSNVTMKGSCIAASHQRTVAL